MSRRIWEINEKYLCPVTGFCLSISDQIQIIRKYCPKHKRRSAFRRMHDFMISNISIESPLSKHVQKLLDKKYSSKIQEWSEISDEKWASQADSFLNVDDFDAFIWVSATCKNLKDNEIERIMGRIHMYTHYMFFEFQDAKTQVQNTEIQYGTLSNKYKNIRARHKELESNLATLKSENTQLLNQNTQLKREIERVKSDNNSDVNFIEKIKTLEKQINLKESAIINLKTINKQLNKKVSSQSFLLNEMEHEFEIILNNIKAQATRCNDCDKIDLCQQRVLIVGGITKMEAYYRKLVTELGGQFQYHDGYCKSGEVVLSNLVKQSDIVICPVDVNSHAACLQVKKTCKESGKEFHMLRKSSVSTIYNTLINVART